MHRLIQMSLFSIFLSSSLYAKHEKKIYKNEPAAQQDETGPKHETLSNLVEMQEAAVQKHSEKPIFGTKKNGTYEWITYKEFGEQVNDFRGGLALLGVEAHDRVAIIADNSSEWAVSCYATLGRGAVFVPMYTNQSVDEWMYKVQDSGAKVLLVANTAIYEKVKEFPTHIPHLQHIVNLDALAAHEPNFASLRDQGHNAPVASTYPANDDTMGFIYTSGTTGNPKGVMLSHRNITSTLMTLPQVIDIRGERSLSFLPWAHVFGQLAELHLLIHLGNSTAFAESPKTIVDGMKEIQPTIFFSVPTVFNRIYDKTMADADQGSVIKRALFKNWRKVCDQTRHGEKTSFMRQALAKAVAPVIVDKVKAAFGGKLKYAVSGGAKLDPKVAEFIDDLGIIVLEGYGLSETSGLIAANTMTHRKIGSVGRIFPGVRVVIDHTAVAAQGDEGEVVAYGPNIMQGYHNLPEKTREDMTKDGGLRTGDIGRIDSDGFLFITGRIKEMYKLENGKYVAPSAYENSAKLSPYIREAFLYGQDKPHNVALICVDEEALKVYAKDHTLTATGEDLLADPEVEQLIKDELAKYAHDFPSYIKPAQFALVTDDWMQMPGFMTPTLKVKRAVIESSYATRLAALYQ